MTVVKITGNTFNLSTQPNCVALGANYNSNSTQGATGCFIWNGNAASQTITLANSLGSFTFSIPSNTVIILSKNSSDTLAAAANSTGIVVNPIQRSPD